MHLAILWQAQQVSASTIQNRPKLSFELKNTNGHLSLSLSLSLDHLSTRRSSHTITHTNLSLAPDLSITVVAMATEASSYSNISSIFSTPNSNNKKSQFTITTTTTSMISKVKVIVRVRPFLAHEIKHRFPLLSCASFYDSNQDQEVTVHLKDPDTRYPSILKISTI